MCTPTHPNVLGIRANGQTAQNLNRRDGQEGQQFLGEFTFFHRCSDSNNSERAVWLSARTRRIAVDIAVNDRRVIAATVETVKCAG
jgi:hypothetical protein